MNAAQVLAAGAPTCCNKSGGGASDDSAVTEIVKAAGIAEALGTVTEPPKISPKSTSAALTHIRNLE